jgi:hypothetical protein
MAIPATDAGQAIAFLRHLFKPYSDGFIEVRALKRSGPLQSSYRLPHCLNGDEGYALGQHIVSLALRGYDVYCGVLPRDLPSGPGVKMGKDNVSHAAALWIDLDGKIPGSSQDLLDSCDIIVSSGNGWHGYVMAATVRGIGHKKDKADFEARCRGFANSILPGTDTVSNCDRILRVPGTLNWKDPDNPKAVTLERGGAIRPRYKESLCVEVFGDSRIDAMLASAKDGKLDPIVPGIRHASGRITCDPNIFFLELEDACIKSKADARWSFLVDIVKADLGEIMRYYFAV